MSNNRMWLFNPQTGHRVLLAKHYGYHWGVWPETDGKDLAMRISEVLGDETLVERKDGTYQPLGSCDWRIEYDCDFPYHVSADDARDEHERRQAELASGLPSGMEPE